MKNLFKIWNKKPQDNHSTNNIYDEQPKKVPITQQKKLVFICIGAMICVLIFEIFIIKNQKDILAHQQVLQTHIEDQAGEIRNTLSDIIHAEAKQVRKSTDAKIADLQQMILNGNTEAVTQLQQIQMKLDEIQKQTKNLDKVSDELMKQIDAKLKHISSSAPVINAKLPQPQTVVATNEDKVTNRYRIYSVNNYGLVLQSEYGAFTIATIGKVLADLGEITSIAADGVVAGDYKIITNPSGFKLNQTAVISAYQ
ncbi:hypothetical protein [Fastidiosibacter lacustris]|uniref:hypothetical protein n=1 Tax=Fastidiosibacter lacustris TaxID=2056695 RepID=UPI000E34A785|nr:hypothetical protein [Fastidiosibacter lacustris]